MLGSVLADAPAALADTAVANCDDLSAVLAGGGTVTLDADMSCASATAQLAVTCAVTLDLPVTP